MKIIKTLMLRRSLLNFFFRLFIFVGIFILYVTNKSLMMDLMTQSIYQGISIIHILWLIFMLMMLGHLFLNERLPMSFKKVHEQYYQGSTYNELELLKFVQKANIAAWTVMLVWLSFNAIFGLLYLFKFIDNADLLMLSIFYFLCDYICILFFCPFQSYIMENSCCVNCRIYDWGHFMMFTPMLFIKDFFSWSLFFTSLIVLLRWELVYAKHPERFWKNSNISLQCSNCTDKICQYKKANPWIPDRLKFFK